MIEAKIGLTIDTDDIDLVYDILDKVHDLLAKEAPAPTIEVWWEGRDIQEVS